MWYEGSGTTNRRFLQADQLGSVVAVSDGAGAVLAINRYDEYGFPQTGNVGRFGYTGQTWYGEIGLANYKARWYSPTLGRFLQTDPIGYEDQINLYAYVGNDPVNWVDPSGMGTECVDPMTGATIICVTAPKPEPLPAPVGPITITNGEPQRKPQSVACPVGQPAVITAPFGQRRGGSIHTGVDLRARMGAPIFAPFQGTVRSVFSGGRGGDSILISNADGSVSGFAHTGAVAGLRPGQTVQAGQQIGVSNGSGTGAPHLHLTHRVTANSPKSNPLATAIGGACNATPK